MEPFTLQSTRLMKLYFILTSLLIGFWAGICVQAFSQTEPQHFSFAGTVGTKDIKAEFLQYDFSKCMQFETPMGRLGTIGKNYQRIKVRFVSVIRNADDPAEYKIYGKTSVMGNVCEFQGTYRIREIRGVKLDITDTDGMLEGLDQRRGLIIADYVFYENPSQQHVGTFKGTAYSAFYLDTKLVPQYDDAGMMADGFTNNAFVGEWSEYNSAASRPCNWGDYRVPASGDLDQGAGEFVPADAYLKNGWATYRKAFVEGDAKAKQEENKSWWN